MKTRMKIALLGLLSGSLLSACVVDLSDMLGEENFLELSTLGFVSERAERYCGPDGIEEMTTSSFTCLDGSYVNLENDSAYRVFVNSKQAFRVCGKDHVRSVSIDGFECYTGEEYDAIHEQEEHEVTEHNVSDQKNSEKEIVSSP